MVYGKIDSSPTVLDRRNLSPKLWLDSDTSVGLKSAATPSDYNDFFKDMGAGVSVPN